MQVGIRAQSESQRERWTVNPPALPSKVQILHPPPVMASMKNRRHFFFLRIKQAMVELYVVIFMGNTSTNLVQYLVLSLCISRQAWSTNAYRMHTFIDRKSTPPGLNHIRIN